jgi:hypothetical protein
MIIHVMYLGIPHDHRSASRSAPLSARYIAVRMIVVRLNPSSEPGHSQHVSMLMSHRKKPIPITGTEVPSYRDEIHCAVITEVASLKVENVDIVGNYRSAGDKRETSADILVDGYPVRSPNIYVLIHFSDTKHSK